MCSCFDFSLNQLVLRNVYSLGTIKLCAKASIFIFASFFQFFRHFCIFSANVLNVAFEDKQYRCFTSYKPLITCIIYTTQQMSNTLNKCIKLGLIGSQSTLYITTLQNCSNTFHILKMSNIKNASFTSRAANVTAV